ncbi:hypothetical protein QTP88_004696 [Uroleucon formosanum]
MENGDKSADLVSDTWKTLRTGEFPEVEDVLYLWFWQKLNRRTPISGKILKEEAKKTHGHDRRTKTDDIRKWIEGDEEENNQFFTDNNIIEEVMAKEKDNDMNYDDKEGEVVVQTVTHSTAIDSYPTFIAWAEENGEDPCDILGLIKLQEKVLKT